MNFRSMLVIGTIFLSACSKEKRSDKAAEKMQDFVVNISNYARGFDNSFIIIPQNGTELAFKENNPEGELNQTYLNAIDGLGVEELYYNGTPSLDDERLSMLQKLKATKKIMVADYVNDEKNISDSFFKNTQQGFLAFPRVNSNYDYKQIPDSVFQSNTIDINILADAKNYLYLISNDDFSSKQDVISRIATTNFDVVLIDLFYNDDEFTKTEIEKLKTKANGAKRLVIAYMNVGSAEKYQYYWKKSWGLHHPLWLRRRYDGYKDEIWVKFWRPDWQEIIYGNDDSYTKKIINAGFDGIYLDNVEAFYFLYYKE